MNGETLAARIAEARKAADMTQEHLAAAIGVDRTALSLIEKGERKASAVELVKLAAVLDIPLAWFVRDPLPAMTRRREAVEFHDADMRRAWEEAAAAERDAEQNPERTAERRRRLIRWVEARKVN